MSPGEGCAQQLLPNPERDPTGVGGNVKSIDILVLSRFFLAAAALGGTEARHKKLTGHLGCRPDREQEPDGPVRAAGDWKWARKNLPGSRGSPGAGFGTSCASVSLTGRKRRAARGMSC